MTVRTAVIGYGLGGANFHAPFVEATEGMALTAIVTSDPGRRAAAHARHPSAELVPDAETLWQRAGDFDLVVISTPNRVHVPLAAAAIEHGLAVVLDKPMAPTAAEGRALVTLAAERGVPFTVFQNRRWDGDFLTLRSLVEAGELGDVVRFESRFERWRPEVNTDAWRERPDPGEAGGLLFDLGSHLIDQALVLFGPVTDVYAEVDRRRPGARVDDDVFVALTHAGGVRSHLWAGVLAAQLGPRFRVLGTRTAWTSWGLDPQENELRAGRRPTDPGFGEVPESAWGRLGSDDDLRPWPTLAGDYRSFWRGVVAMAAEGAPPPVDPRDSVRGLELIEAAAAMAGGRR